MVSQILNQDQIRLLPYTQVVVKGGEALLSEAVKGKGALLGSTYVDINWESFYRGEVGGRGVGG
jgi:hypothetical protein